MRNEVSEFLGRYKLRHDLASRVHDFYQYVSQRQLAQADTEVLLGQT